VTRRAGPSLALALPVFIVGLGLSITVALGLAFFRGTYLDFWGVTVLVAMMSISALFFIVAGQFVLARVLQLMPISGSRAAPDTWRFLLLPIVVSVVARLGPRGALLPHAVPRGNRQGLRAHRALERDSRSRRCCSATCCAMR
jgi:peptide/nickel transport system permease protein